MMNCLQKRGLHNSGSKLNDTNIRGKVLEQLKSISGFNAALVPDEQNMMYVQDNLKVAHEGILEIERNSREQSNCDVWYAERSKRVTASNFGSIMKRRKKSILHPYLRMYYRRYLCRNCQLLLNGEKVMK